MLKVTKIIEVSSGYLICELNNGLRKKIDIAPLIKRHKKFRGIEKFKNEAFVKTADIGLFGEIYWKEAITTSSNEKWNYDISPEYINAFGETV